MLVPLIATSPPVCLADWMPTPGPDTITLVLLKGATTKDVP